MSVFVTCLQLNNTNETLVHSDDRVYFEKTYSDGQVYRIVFPYREAWMMIQNGSEFFRIKPALINHCYPKSDFQSGQRVFIWNKRIWATIDRCIWHGIRFEYYYFLSSEGKRLSKRFYADELVEEIQPSKLLIPNLLTEVQVVIPK